MRSPSRAVAPTNSGSPSSRLTREPIQRAPQGTALDTPRVKNHSTLFPSSGGRELRNGYTGDPRLGQEGSNNLLHFGTEPLHLGYGPKHSYSSHYPNHGHHHRPYHPGYNGYYGYRGYGPRNCYNRYGYGYGYGCYPRSCYGYSGFYPWYGFGLGFGYTYSSPYYSEPYAVQVYETPVYDVPTYATTGVYAAPAETYVTPPAQTVVPQPTAPSEQVTGSADGYRTLEPSDELRTVVLNGNAAFAAARYEEAKGLYIRAVLADERDGYVKTLYAWANFAMGDYDTAAASLRRALLTTPDLVDYPMDLRTLYSDSNLLGAQSERLARHVAENPEHRESRFVLGYLQYSVGEAQSAASIFQELASRDAGDTLVGQLADAATRASRGQTPPPPKP